MTSFNTFNEDETKLHRKLLCQDRCTVGAESVVMSLLGQAVILSVRHFPLLSLCSMYLNGYLGPLVGAAGGSPQQASAQAILIVPGRTAH